MTYQTHEATTELARANFATFRIYDLYAGVVCIVCFQNDSVRSSILYF